MVRAAVAEFRWVPSGVGVVAVVGESNRMQQLHDFALLRLSPFGFISTPRPILSPFF
jgi:hypothetical protein